MDVTEKLFGSQRAITIWVVTVVFAIVFPAYFATMAGSLDAASGGSSGAKGGWQVNFTESTLTFDETARLSDGETLDSFYELTDDMLNEGQQIAFVNITIECNDNDEGGVPTSRDAVDATLDPSGVEGELSEQNDGGICNGGDPAASFSYDIAANYSGTTYIASGVSKQSILDGWDDGGLARGEWLCSVTMDVNTLPPGFLDNDEDVTVSWSVVLFTVEVSAIAGEL